MPKYRYCVLSSSQLLSLCANWMAKGRYHTPESHQWHSQTWHSPSRGLQRLSFPRPNQAAGLVWCLGTVAPISHEHIASLVNRVLSLNCHNLSPTNDLLIIKMSICSWSRRKTIQDHDHSLIIGISIWWKACGEVMTKPVFVAVLHRQTL